MAVPRHLPMKLPHLVYASCVYASCALAALLVACSPEGGGPTELPVEPVGVDGNPDPRSPAVQVPPLRSASDERSDASLGPFGAGGPTLLAPDPNHDFGGVYAGVVLEHTFALEAAGGADLVIKQIKPGCGCTVATPAIVDEDGSRRPYVLDTPLAAGTKLELEVAFDTTGKSGPQAKAINIYCNDPRGVVRLGVQANLEPFLNVSPAVVQLGSFSVGESRSATATLLSRAGDPVRLSVDPARLLSGLDVSLTPKDPDAAGRSSVWTAELTLGGDDARPGRVHFRVPVLTDIQNPGVADDAPELQLYIGGSIVLQADVLDLYVVTPRQLFFGPVKPDSTAARALRLECFDADHPLVDPKVRLVGPGGEALADADRYHATIAAADTPGVFTVELLVDGLPAATGLFEGAVVIETANPDRPTIEVPFKGIVQ
jgi:hypothetical protein